MPRRTGEWQSRQPSLADVAALAGVSTQTVSRVVNGTANVLPDTRQKVERGLAELGYRAHSGARALATGKFGSLGVPRGGFRRARTGGPGEHGARPGTGRRYVGTVSRVKVYDLVGADGASTVIAEYACSPLPCWPYEVRPDSVTVAG
jgi:hypothetical protein